MTALADGGHQHAADTWASAFALVPVLALLVSGYAYAAALAGQPPRPRSVGRTPASRVVAWYAGLGVVAVAMFSPIAGNHAASAHMLQHELLLTVAPVLLVAGLDRRITLPVVRTIVAPALRTGAGRRWLAVLSSPVLATALWVAVALGWHLPPAYDAALGDARLHVVQQVSLVGAGIVFWIVVTGRLPSVRRATVGPRIAALGAAMAASGVLGAVLIWSNTVVHSGYAGAEPWFGLSPLQDQRLAGALMMVLDMPVLLGALGWVVARWARWQSPAPATEPDAVGTPVPEGV
jgi:putative membrane protein